MLNKGHRPYMKQEEFQKALAFAGDIVVIHLGINDTDPRNWPDYRDFFVRDYLALIDSFRVVNPDVRILVARMTPIADRHPRFESGTRDWHGEIQQAIETVARYGCSTPYGRGSGYFSENCVLCHYRRLRRSAFVRNIQ